MLKSINLSLRRKRDFLYFFSRKKTGTLETKTIIKPPVQGNFNFKDEQGLNKIVTFIYYYFIFFAEKKYIYFKNHLTLPPV